MRRDIHHGGSYHSYLLLIIALLPLTITGTPYPPSQPPPFPMPPDVIDNPPES